MRQLSSSAPFPPAASGSARGARACTSPHSSVMLPILWASHAAHSNASAACLVALRLAASPVPWHAVSHSSHQPTQCIHTSDASNAHSPASQQPTRHRPPRITKAQALKQSMQLGQLPPPIAALEAASVQGAFASDGLLLTRVSLGSRYPVEGSRADFVRMLRRHNTSLPDLVGQVILARILLITKEHVFVDTGFHSVSEMPRADLDINDVQEPSASSPLPTRANLSDIRVGDVLRVRVDSLYTPYGDMQLAPAKVDAFAQRRMMWRALIAQQAEGEPVMGRVLNQCTGGYAVGVAGFVGLLPYAKAATATVQSMGTLEQFYVDTVDRNRMSMTLLDARMVSREQVQMWQRRKQARRQAQAAQVENLVKAQAGEGSEGQAGQTGGAEKAQAAGEAVSAH